jgi:hypothetical protein
MISKRHLVVVGLFDDLGLANLEDLLVVIYDGQSWSSRPGPHSSRLVQCLVKYCKMPNSFQLLQDTGKM